MPRFGRIALVGALAAVLGLAAIQAAGATGESNDPGTGTRTLAGEEFLANDVAMTFRCDDPNQQSTVQFSASGPATGPYPGTFTAQGTVTIAPQTIAGPRLGTVAGALLSLNETFTINSPLGTVAGHKTLQAGQPTDQSEGTCMHVTNFVAGPVSGGSGTVVELFSQPAYEATIQEPSGVYQVHGETSFSTTEIDLIGSCSVGPCPYRQASFDEFFLTSIPGAAGNDNEELESQYEEQLEKSHGH